MTRLSTIRPASTDDMTAREDYSSSLLVSPRTLASRPDPASSQSGNTGIGLAGLAAAKGYPFRAYIPGRVSKERFEVVSAFGAEIVKIEDVPAMVNALKDSNNDFFAGVTALKQSLRDDKELFFSDQAFNESNVKAHHDTTGPEIWEDTDGNVDIAVISVGTGGTITGIGSFLKEQDPDIKIVAVEPIIVNDKDGKPKEITGVHRFSDVEERCKPGILNEGIIDEIIEVDPFVACKTAQLAARTDGILVGESSGAAFYAAAQLAKRPENEGKRIVAIAPDTGLRYLSTGLFEKEAE